MNFRKLLTAALFALSLLTINVTTFSETVVVKEYFNNRWWIVTYIDGVKSSIVADDIL